MVSKRKNKKKARGKHQRIYIRRSIRRKLQKQWCKLKPGLAKRRALFPEGRGLGVGGKKRKAKGEGPPPADLHPPLNKKWGA